MKMEDIVRYLRYNLDIQTKDSPISDPLLLAMTDEELTEYVKVVCASEFPYLPSFDIIDNEKMGIIILLAKKELYWALATRSAPLYDLRGGDGASLSKDQRFKHYMSLINAINDEVNEYKKSGGTNGTLTSYDVSLASKFMSVRNYELGVEPKIYANADKVTLNEAYISWSVLDLRHFKCYEVYVSEEEIYSAYEDTISDTAKLVKTIDDIKVKKCLVSDLQPNTQYHVLVRVIEKNKLRGQYELVFVTPGPKE